MSGIAEKCAADANLTKLVAIINNGNPQWAKDLIAKINKLYDAKVERVKILEDIEELLCSAEFPLSITTRNYRDRLLEIAYIDYAKLYLAVQSECYWVCKHNEFYMVFGHCAQIALQIHEFAHQCSESFNGDWNVFDKYILTNNLRLNDGRHHKYRDATEMADLHDCVSKYEVDDNMKDMLMRVPWTISIAYGATTKQKFCADLTTLDAILKRVKEPKWVPAAIEAFNRIIPEIKQKAVMIYETYNAALEAPAAADAAPEVLVPAEEHNLAVVVSPIAQVYDNIDCVAISAEIAFNKRQVAISAEIARDVAIETEEDARRAYEMCKANTVAKEEQLQKANADAIAAENDAENCKQVKIDTNIEQFTPKTFYICAENVRRQLDDSDKRRKADEIISRYHFIADPAELAALAAKLGAELMAIT